MRCGSTCRTQTGKDWRQTLRGPAEPQWQDEERGLQEFGVGGNRPELAARSEAEAARTGRP